MNKFRDSMIFLGSEKEKGIIIYRFNSVFSDWEKIKSVGIDVPKCLYYDYRLRGLYVGSEEEHEPHRLIFGKTKRQSLNSYTVQPQPDADSVLKPKVKQYTDHIPTATAFRHICVDVNEVDVYAVSSRNVSASFQNPDATMFGAFDRTYVCHRLAIHANLIVKNAFISKTHPHYTSFFEVFCITGNYSPCSGDKRIFIKFKFPHTFDQLTDTSIEIRDYYTCVVDVKTCLITTYENTDGRFVNAPSQILSFPKNTNCKVNTIADVVVAVREPILFVANSELKSIASCVFSERRETTVVPQGSQQDTTVVPQGSQQNTTVVPQGSQRRTTAVPQGSQQRTTVVPQGSQQRTTVVPQGSHQRTAVAPQGSQPEERRIFGVKNYYKLSDGLTPRRLFFNDRNNCLYVTTNKNTVVILGVNFGNGRMYLSQEIKDVPDPTCITAT